MTFSDAKRAIAYSRSRILALSASVIWIGFLFYLASLHRLPRVPTLSDSSFQSLGHFGTHVILAALIYLAALSPSAGRFQRIQAASVAALISTALGVAIEGLHYLLPSRSAQVSDLLFAAAGSLLGALTIFGLGHFRILSRYLSLITMGVVMGLTLLGMSIIFAWDPSLFPHARSLVRQLL